jgi:DNA recombination protein RmuC
VAGPTTLAALLTSLQLGFRTLAIEQRSSEVWKLLGAVKADFGRFGETLEGVRRRLEQAHGDLDGAARRSRAIERRLREVEDGSLADDAPALRDPEGELET